jgi:hypothetical protein
MDMMPRSGYKDWKMKKTKSNQLSFVVQMIANRKVVIWRP